MKISQNFEIQEVKAYLKGGMEDYLDSGDYTQADIEECIGILEEYLEKIEVVNEKEKAMKIVAATVQRLNTLNESTNETLIETGQREEICEIIILAGHLKGFNTRDEDITEEWREW